MHFKSILVSAVTFTISFIPFTVASPASEPCTLPQDLQREVSARYPKAKVVSLVDLEEDDRKFFKADHHDNCPGLVKVDFYGDGKPTLAFILIMQGDAKNHVQFVVAHLVGNTWETTNLDTGGAGTDVPVVWSEPPGQYQDVYGNKTLRSSRPVIVFRKYESWGILYAWTGKRVSKIWIAD